MQPGAARPPLPRSAPQHAQTVQPALSCAQLLSGPAGGDTQAACTDVACESRAAKHSRVRRSAHSMLACGAAQHTSHGGAGLPAGGGRARQPDAAHHQRHVAVCVAVRRGPVPQAQPLRERRICGGARARLARRCRSSHVCGLSDLMSAQGALGHSFTAVS